MFNMLKIVNFKNNELLINNFMIVYNSYNYYWEKTVLEQNKKDLLLLNIL